jgi:hypothetical protein
VPITRFDLRYHLIDISSWKTVSHGCPDHGEFPVRIRTGFSAMCGSNCLANPGSDRQPARAGGTPDFAEFGLVQKHLQAFTHMGSI